MRCSIVRAPPALRAIELRLCYGEFAVRHARQARPTIDRFIDGAARRGITIVAWTVPARGFSYEDLAATVASAAAIAPQPAMDTRSRRRFGTRRRFLGRRRGSGGPRWQRMCRACARRSDRACLLAATVEDPVIEHLQRHRFAVRRDRRRRRCAAADGVLARAAHRSVARGDARRTLKRRSYGVLQQLAGGRHPDRYRRSNGQSG